MLTRRHVRIKVMQVCYAHSLKGMDITEDLKPFLKASIQKTFELHVVLLVLLRDLTKHAQEQYELKKQQQRFIENPTALGLPLMRNRFLQQILNAEELTTQIKRQRIKFWDLKFDYIHQLYEDILKAEPYLEYASLSSPTLVQERNFILQLYKELVAPTAQLYDFLEEHQLTWTDDFPLVNTFLLKQFKSTDPDSQLTLPHYAQFEDEVDFGAQLLGKTLEELHEINAIIAGKTPNWETDRIAELDKIILQLAITEFLFFQEIPPKVTLNEYLEIAKDYSTPKSNVFVNGVLDKLVKEFQESGQMIKRGRGLK